MTTFIRRAAFAALAFVGSVSVALAQPTVPGAGNVGAPPLSPYLNLLRNNNNNANPADANAAGAALIGGIINLAQNIKAMERAETRWE